MSLIRSALREERDSSYVPLTHAVPGRKVLMSAYEMDRQTLDMRTILNADLVFGFGSY